MSTISFKIDSAHMLIFPVVLIFETAMNNDETLIIPLISCLFPYDKHTLYTDIKFSAFDIFLILYLSASHYSFTYFSQLIVY